MTRNKICCPSLDIATEQCEQFDADGDEDQPLDNLGYRDKVDRPRAFTRRLIFVS